jgi:hypothetical protein
MAATGIQVLLYCTLYGALGAVGPYLGTVKQHSTW